MNRLIAAATVVVLLLGCSTVFAGWGHVAPVVVQPYYPLGPVYAYPAPVVVARPVIAPAPVVVETPGVAPVPVWAGPPVVIRSKVYIPGRPVRNVLRAVVP